MNVFVLDANPKLAAQFHHDIHVRKMIVETGQLLCTAMNLLGGNGVYKTTHQNHPSSIFTRNSKENFEWVLELGVALCEEFEYRFEKIHKTKSVILDCKYNYLSLSFPNINLTPFAQAMPEEFKNNNPVVAYRNYYQTKKFMKNGKIMDIYTKRERPYWYD